MDYIIKRIDYCDLTHESFRCKEPTLYEIMWDEVKFEILINYRPDSIYSTVFGTGAINNEKRSILPIFSRATWMGEFSFTGIWYFDPTVYIDETINLAWYYGTNKRWFLKDISHLLTLILNNIGINISNTLFCGSSGGGFSSIMLATMLRGKATVFNPQFNAKVFEAENHTTDTIIYRADKILDMGEELIDERLNVANFIIKENYVPLLHVFINTQSANDVLTQLPELLNAFHYSKTDCTNRLKIDFYSADRGHNGMPEKQDCIQHIENDVRTQLPLNVHLESNLKNGLIKMNVSTFPEYPDTEYEYHLFSDYPVRMHRKLDFSANNSHAFKLMESGNYTVSAVVRHKNPMTNIYSYYKSSADYEFTTPYTVKLNTELVQNKLYVFIDAKTPYSQLQYACYLYSDKNSLPIIKLRYQEKPFFEFELNEQGTYYAKVYIKANEEFTLSKFTPKIDYYSQR